MRVVCDNCGASYKIPETKLTKDVNKATCRKCGHAIYIRKSTAVAESAPVSANAGEERTLITSSADLQARARGGFDDMAPRRAADPASQEATLPRAELGGPDPQGHNSPSLTIVPPDHPSPPTLSPAPSLSYAPPPAGLNAAPDLPTVRERPAFQPRPPSEVATERQKPAPAAPAPAATRPAERPPREPAVREMAREPSREMPRETSRPSPMADRAMPPVAATPSFDPRGDLTFAMLASLLAVFGVLVLLANSFIGSVWVTGVGAFFAILGCVATVLVLITGGRGTRSASLIASVLGGFVFAGGGAAAAVAAGTMFTGFGTAAPPAVAVVTPPPVTEPVVAPPVVTPPPVEPPPVEPVAAVTEPVAPPPEPVAVTPPPEPVKAEPVKSEPKKTTSSSSSSKSSSSSSSSSRSTSSSTPERIAPTTSSSTSTSSTPTKTATSSTPSTSTSSTPTASTSSSASAAAASTGVSTTVIDTMMRSNKSVKNCFITEKNESGTLPSGVKVKFTIQPSGKVSSAAIPSGDYQGTAFDSCLSGAVKSISFPPFTGDPVTLTYPFRL